MAQLVALRHALLQYIHTQHDNQMNRFYHMPPRAEIAPQNPCIRLPHAPAIHPSRVSSPARATKSRRSRTTKSTKSPQTSNRLASRTLFRLGCRNSPVSKRRKPRRTSLGNRIGDSGTRPETKRHESRDALETKQTSEAKGSKTLLLSAHGRDSQASTTGSTGHLRAILLWSIR